MESKLRINKEILKGIEKLVDQFPNMRFGQILANFVCPEIYSSDHKDIFYTESTTTLATVQNVTKGLKTYKTESDL